MSDNESARAALTKQSGEKEIRAYFQGVLEAAQSSEQYPVNLDDVWMLVYSDKAHAVSALKKTFVQDVDYQIFTQNRGNSQRGRGTDIYRLTTSCLEYFIARKVRPVFEVYRQVFHRAASMVPLTYKDALKQLLASVEQREQLQAENREQRLQIEQQQETIRKDAPKVDYYDKVLAAKGDLNVSEIARFLGMTAAELNIKLRDAGIIYKTSARSKTWLLRKPYCHWNLANPRTTVFTRSDGTEGASVITVYNQRGVRFIRALHQCNYNVREAIRQIKGENERDAV